MGLVAVPIAVPTIMLGLADGIVMYGVAGPIPSGVIVRRLYFVVTVQQAAPASGFLTIAVSLGSSSEASLVSLESGSSMVRKSPIKIGVVPAMVLSFRQDLLLSFEIPWGVKNSGGPGFVIVAGWVLGGATGASMVAGVEAVELVEAA